jgi:CelD/BcsL family acetyltransferase involved in cellulose biosynthesis
MKVTVLPGHSLTERHSDRWSMLQQSTAALASPYFCPAFTQAVASVRRGVHVGLVEQDGEIVAFFPFQRGGMRTAKPVGWPMSDCQGIIARDDTTVDPSRLLRGCGLSIWDFDHLLVGQTAFHPYHVQRTESPVIDLSAGFDAYKAERKQAGSRFVEQTARKRRKMERELGPLRFETHVTDPDVLRQVIEWKSAQYERTGLVNVLGHAWTGRVLERICGIQTDAFAGTLSVLYVGDRVAAAHMGMRSATVWHWWFPAYDRELEHYSPGVILLLEMMERAPSAGIRLIDLGKGDETYKRRAATGAVALAEGSVALPSVATTVRKAKRDLESWVRRVPIPEFVRSPMRRLRRAERWLTMR